MKTNTRTNIAFKANISGAFNAVLVSIPKCIAYGALVFAPLGERYYSLGLISALTIYIIINIITSFYYGNKILLSGTSSLVAILMVSSLKHIILSNSAQSTLSLDLILSFFFLLLLMVSLFQLLFGIFSSDSSTVGNDYIWRHLLLFNSDVLYLCKPGRNRRSNTTYIR